MSLFQKWVGIMLCQAMTAYATICACGKRGNDLVLGSVFVFEMVHGPEPTHGGVGGLQRGLSDRGLI